MDAVEQWLRAMAADEEILSSRLVIEDLANEWHVNPAVTQVTYTEPNPLAEFLDKVEGPAMIGLDPVIYPACAVCSTPWMMRRTKGTWAWSSDCAHKQAACKLVRA